MIDFLSSWAEQIVIAIILASILEMILPENKNKKYVKMVIGVYILFSIISPIIQNQNTISASDFGLEELTQNATQEEIVDQTSMDERLKKLYIEELEKDVKNKVEEEGYIATSCKVSAILEENSQEKGIKKIEIVIKRDENKQQEEKEDESKIGQVNKVEIQVGLDKYIKGNEKNEGESENQITKQEIQKLKEKISQAYEIDNKKVHITKE